MPLKRFKLPHHHAQDDEDSTPTSLAKPFSVNLFRDEEKVDRHIPPKYHHDVHYPYRSKGAEHHPQIAGKQHGLNITPPTVELNFPRARGLIEPTSDSEHLSGVPAWEGEEQERQDGTLTTKTSAESAGANGGGLEQGSHAYYGYVSGNMGRRATVAIGLARGLGRDDYDPYLHDVIHGKYNGIQMGKNLYIDDALLNGKQEHLYYRKTKRQSFGYYFPDHGRGYTIRSWRESGFDNAPLYIGDQVYKASQKPPPILPSDGSEVYSRYGSHLVDFTYGGAADEFEPRESDRCRGILGQSVVHNNGVARLAGQAGQGSGQVINTSLIEGMSNLRSAPQSVPFSVIGHAKTNEFMAIIVPFQPRYLPVYSHPKQGRRPRSSVDQR